MHKKTCIFFILLLIFDAQPVKATSIYDRLKKSAYNAYHKHPVFYQVMMPILATSLGCVNEFLSDPN